MTEHHSGPMGFAGWSRGSRLPHSILSDHEDAMRDAAQAFRSHYAGKTNEWPSPAALWSAINAYLEYKPGRTVDAPPWLNQVFDLITAINDALPKDHPVRQRAEALDLVPLIPVSAFTHACRTQLAARTKANEAWDDYRATVFDASERRRKEKP